MKHMKKAFALSGLFVLLTFASALVHGGLRFFAREHVAASLGLPGDWYRAERMLRAGVRFAHRPGTLFRYYPSQSWGTTPAPPDRPGG